MKKALSILLAVFLLTAALGTLTASAASFEVTVSDLIGIEPAEKTEPDAAVVYDGGSVAADNGVTCTLSFAVTVTGTERVRVYHAFVNGQADDSVLRFNYTEVSDCTTVFLTLAEGHYDEVLLKGTAEDGFETDIVRFTDLTVTAPVHSIDDSGIPVEYAPV